MSYTYDEDTVSDLHKDAYGFRPSSGWWSNWKAASSEAKQVIWDDLLESLEMAIEAEKDRELRAGREFESRVRENINLGAGDQATAIRWILQAEGLEEEKDPSYICYCLGLSYDMEGMFK